MLLILFRMEATLFIIKGEGIMNLAYQKNIEEGHFLEGCVSRKKHVVPLIMEVLEN